MADTSPKDIVYKTSDCQDSEVKEVLKELVETVSEGRIFVNENGKNLETTPSTDLSNFVEMEEGDSFIQNDESSEDEKVHPLPKQKRRSNAARRTKSVSENESVASTITKEIIRRKFGSEGAILSAAEDIMPPEKRKELNEAIEKYIDKLIKDSIFKAVKSVNVDSLCEDIIKDFSNRRNSLNVESEDDFIVEQRLTSNSISELVELGNTADSNDKKRVECISDSFLPGDSGRMSESESLDDGQDDVDHSTYMVNVNADLMGYLADLEDTASIDDLKSAEESLNSSFSSNLEHKGFSRINSEESSEKSGENINQIESTQSTDYEAASKDSEIVNAENADHVTQPKEGDPSLSKENNNDEQQKISSTDSICEQNELENSDELRQNLDSIQLQQNTQSQESACKQTELPPESCPKSDENLPSTENVEKLDQKLTSPEKTCENVDLIVMSPEEDSLLHKNDSKTDDSSMPPPDITDTLPEQKVSAEEQTKVSWKVGYLHVKLPHKTRGKTHLKAWKKRRVIIQPDEFVNDPKNPSLVISVYGADSKKHETTFWHSVSSQKAVVFRSSSRTHRYAFTISEGGQPLIHLSSDKESTTQEWMAAIRSVLWPPSPFMELEKMLSGREFEISLVDNEFSYHCGLLGMYGYLSITPKKLILLHPQQGYVIQEWYLNTVDKFKFVPQQKSDDVHKVLCMTTCSDSSTGQGELIFFCNEAVTFLQSLASNIHQVLSYHSKQEGGKYQKELEEMAEWLVAPPQDCLNVNEKADEHYKVPPRQVKSLLDIPNFIFNKSLSPVASAIYPAPKAEVLEPLGGTKNKPTTASQDSGISTCTSSEDFLNCSVASFIIGGGPMTGKSSDSELSDTYTPPRTPEMHKKIRCEVLQEEHIPAGEA